MAISGQITITTAGTPVAGDDTPGSEFYIAPHPDNTGAVFVGGPSSSEKYPIPPGSQVIISVSNLKELEFDAANNGDIVCWLKYW